MGMIIGRKHEMADLDEYCRSDKAELICVYGRRRVGKTYLVENTFNHAFAFRATGSEDRRVRTQLRVFGEALRRCGWAGAGGTAAGRPTARQAVMPADWFEAFARLRELLESPDVVRSENGRRVVFLDEFPWFAGKRSDFLPAFSDFWNGWASAQDDVVVIVCGSATSWIIKNILENTGSLYNRITRRMYIAPFDLHDTEQMIQSLRLGWSREAVLCCYLVFGGLPYYLDMLDRRKSLAENINALCLDVRAPLSREVPLLMEATLGDSPLHRDVLRLLADTRMGIRWADLQAKTGASKGSLSRALDDLEKCGYVRSYKNRYERYMPKIYQLIDPFLLFGFKFLDRQRPVQDWVDFEGTPAYYAWRGNAFEVACLAHIDQLRHAMGISAVRTEAFPWVSSGTGRGAQVDLVLERADGVTNLCEMKYTDAPFVVDKSYEEELRHKVEVFREQSGTKNALQLTLVSVNGLKPNTHSWGVAGVVDMDALFAF